jgi:hypothetical protein
MALVFAWMASSKRHTSKGNMMGACDTYLTESRFIIEKELTQVYVLIEAYGDCPFMIQGWKHRTFPASMSVIDILNSQEFADNLLWPGEAPPEPRERKPWVEQRA